MAYLNWSDLKPTEENIRDRKEWTDDSLFAEYQQAKFFGDCETASFFYKEIARRKGLNPDGTPLSEVSRG